MRLFIHSIILAVLTFNAAHTVAQEECLTDEVHDAMLETSETYARNFDAVREAIALMRSSSQRSMETITLPVVVHVIHKGSPIGVEENISDEQIASAIAGLNDDFRKTPGTPGDGIGVDTFIQFELAKRTPDNQPTNGILRVDGSVLSGYSEGGIRNKTDVAGADEAAVKGLTTWYGDDYINIFVVTEINDNDGQGGTQGFAYPGPTFDVNDGIVVLYNAFGLVGELKPGRDMNRTITHEMGHHLSLYHTFENTEACGVAETDCSAQGDEVCDTPPTRSNNQGCNQPVCEGSQVENYMDYTPQDCKNAFTAGQSERMRACIESVRSSLLSSQALVNVGEQDLTVVGLSNLGATTCLSSVSPKVLVSNLGIQSVQGFELITSLNDSEPFTTVHSTNVEPGSTVEVTLPEMSLTEVNDFTFEVRLIGGGQDEYPANDVYAQRVDFSAADLWTMTLNTYNNANEITWYIENENGEAMMDGGNYEAGVQATYVAQGCITEGCYTLVMEDAFGDGMCAFDQGGDGVCDFGGSMSLTNGAGDTLAGFSIADSDFGASATWLVCATETTSVEGCEDTNSNGICDSNEVAGCQDQNACNFMAEAMLSDDSCTYPSEAHLDCNGNCLQDDDADGICNEEEVVGCQDESANNYDANATDDNGTCQYSVFGCTDVTACNYDSNATDNDGNCDFAPDYYDCNGACLADADGDGVCDALEITGCTDEGANNYDAEATDDNGTCTYDAFGCTDNNACNFNAFANVDNGSCVYPADNFDCNGNCVNDSDEDGICDEFEVPGCDNPAACNFDANVTDNDGSCAFAEAFMDCDGNCLNDADGDGICDEFEVEEENEDFENETDDVAEAMEDMTLTMFPNPLNTYEEMVYIRGLENDGVSIRVLGTDGRIAWEGTGFQTAPGVTGFPIRESVAAGTYFIQVDNATTASVMRLLVR